jgi:hypothetical protein
MTRIYFRCYIKQIVNVFHSCSGRSVSFGEGWNVAFNLPHWMEHFTFDLMRCSCHCTGGKRSLFVYYYLYCGFWVVIVKWISRYLNKYCFTKDYLNWTMQKGKNWKLKMNGFKIYWMVFFASIPCSYGFGFASSQDLWERPLIYPLPPNQTILGLE